MPVATRMQVTDPSTQHRTTTRPLGWLLSFCGLDASSLSFVINSSSLVGLFFCLVFTFLDGMMDLVCSFTAALIDGLHGKSPNFFAPFSCVWISS